VVAAASLVMRQYNTPHRREFPTLSLSSLQNREEALADLVYEIAKSAKLC